MLVFTRKVGESFLIGDDIIVKVLDIKKGEVRLGITAPSGVPVHRQEIHEKLQQERAAGASTPSFGARKSGGA